MRHYILKKTILHFENTYSKKNSFWISASNESREMEAFALFELVVGSNTLTGTLLLRT